MSAFDDEFGLFGDERRAKKTSAVRRSARARSRPAKRSSTISSPKTNARRAAGAALASGETERAERKQPATGSRWPRRNAPVKRDPARPRDRASARRRTADVSRQEARQQSRRRRRRTPSRRARRRPGTRSRSRRHRQGDRPRRPRRASAAHARARRRGRPRHDRHRRCGRGGRRVPRTRRPFGRRDDPPTVQLPKRNIENPNRLAIGRLGGVFGIRGELKWRMAAGTVPPVPGNDVRCTGRRRGARSTLYGNATPSRAAARRLRRYRDARRRAFARRVGAVRRAR